QIEASTPAQDASPAALTALLESDTVFYTPAVVHTPAQVEHDIRRLRSTLRSLRVEDLERTQRVQLAAIREHERVAEAERQCRLFTISIGMPIHHQTPSPTPPRPTCAWRANIITPSSRSPIRPP